MELKYKQAVRRLMNKMGSNRTFMELKYMYCVEIRLHISVLIAPLWN